MKSYCFCRSSICPECMVQGITRKNLQNNCLQKIREIEHQIVVSMLIGRWQTCFQIDAFVGIY